ncbi:C4-dicarboxylate ABC transporter permease [Synergistales bacterium]|nr:C4-dicarboxylate ABC transporter permease [Synergistales bacterium]
MSAAILIGSFLFLLIFNVPIAVGLASAALIGFFMFDLSLSPVAVNYFTAGNKFVLLAIPFFILAGNIMEKAEISQKLIDFARSLVGHYKNGIAIVCVMVSCFFAAISGSGPATVAALGMIVIPAMIKAGYSDNHSSALMATAGSIGVIIPPSISFVVFGSITGVSIGDLFMAGVIPGILMGICLIIGMIIVAQTCHFDLKPLPRASGKERLKAFTSALWALLMPAIILGGIYGGVFTPTEAAAVACVYGLFVGIFVYGTVKWSQIYRIFVDSSAQTAVVMFIVMASSIYSYVTTVQGIAADATDLVMRLSGGSQVKFLLIVNILLLIVGCFLDGNSALYLFVPILYPVAMRLGVPPLAFGVLMVMNLAIGMVTPPVGVNLYVACGISGVSVKRICIGVWPFILASLTALFSITYIPQLCTFLPRLLR